jgi:hypothetical protein
MNSSSAPPGTDIDATRRGLLLSPLLGALFSTAAHAGKLNQSETQITLPDQIKWAPWSGGPPHIGEVATLHGGLVDPGKPAWRQI